MVPVALHETKCKCLSVLQNKVATLSVSKAFLLFQILEHKTGIDLTVSLTLIPSKNYTCFISRRFGLFLIHLQSQN